MKLTNDAVMVCGQAVERGTCTELDMSGPWNRKRGTSRKSQQKNCGEQEAQVEKASRRIVENTLKAKGYISENRHLVA